jgi:hypothetical protein
VGDDAPTSPGKLIDSDVTNSTGIAERLQAVLHAAPASNHVFNKSARGPALPEFEKLRDQLTYLRTSCVSYDAGHKQEAIWIALLIRDRQLGIRYTYSPSTSEVNSYWSETRFPKRNF